MDRLTDAVARGIGSARISLRLLAERVGVSHVHLFRITRGERRATPELARKVARALKEHSRTLAAAANRIRRAAPRRTR